MSKTLNLIRARAHVAFVDDERELEHGIIVTLAAGYSYAADPGCGVRGFDTVKEAEAGSRSSVIEENTNGSAAQ